MDLQMNRNGEQKMFIRWCVGFALTSLCLLGCQPDSPAVPSGPNEASQEPDDSDMTSIEPGHYIDGPEMERVSQLLETADARISLDYHQGIEWYDPDEESWQTKGNVDDLEALLQSTEGKRLLTISTGKADWDKYDEYLQKIRGFAEASGYETTIVTSATGMGLHVSDVIRSDR